VFTELWRWCLYLVDQIGLEAAGILVLATGSGGPEGSTEALGVSCGNSLACAGALREWADRTYGGRGLDSTPF